MRSIVVVLALATSLLAPAVRAAVGSDFPVEIYFPDPTDLKKLTFRFHDVMVDSGNACNSAAECEKKYRLEHEENHRLLTIESVTVPRDEQHLHLLLKTPPADIKGLVLSAFGLKTTALVPSNSQPKTGYQRFPIKSQLKQLDIDDSEQFEGFISPVRLQYQVLTKVEQADLKRLRAAISRSLSITDPADFDRSYSGGVRHVELDAEGRVVQVMITGAPRAKRLNLKMGGVESYGATPLDASTVIQTAALPRGRDDASMFLRGAIEANDIKKERKYTLDVRARDAWRAGERWQIGPTLDATVGNKTAKAPNTGALSMDFRYFIASRSNMFRSRILLAPIFRTDREFKNENLGADILWEMVIPKLDQPLEQRRKAEKAIGGPPLTRVWGWSVRPVVGFEVGRHIKSSSDQIDNEAFSRIRGGLVVGVERGRWKLSASGAYRYLFEDELLLNESGVVTIDANEKRFARIDLTYDIGIVGLTLTHMNGRQPPAWSATDSTSFGLTWKY